MQSYNELQAFLEDVQQRKMDLNDQKNVMIMKREKLRNSWEDAVFNGEGEKDAKQAMQDLEDAIEVFSDHIRILEERVKTSSKVQELAQAVHDDCKHTLKGMRNNYIAQAEKVIAAKEVYLRELAIMGEIKNIGSTYSFYAGEANRYIPGEKFHVGLNADSFDEVKLSEQQVREVYKNGRK